MKRRQVSVLLAQLSIGALLGGLSASSYCDQCKSVHLFNHHSAEEGEGEDEAA